MNFDEMMTRHVESEERKADMTWAFNKGCESAKTEIKRNKAYSSLLKEFVGYEKEYLITTAGFKQFNKQELIEIILEQRELMKYLYENLDDKTKSELKDKIDRVIYADYK